MCGTSERPERFAWRASSATMRRLERKTVHMGIPIRTVENILVERKVGEVGRWFVLLEERERGVSGQGGREWGAIVTLVTWGAIVTLE